MPYFTHRGRRLFFREQGGGPPLLILAGNTASSACHGGELAHFGARYRAVALDFLGTGMSDRAAAWPRDWWAAGAASAAALIDHLGAGPAVVVGTSGGAAVALQRHKAYKGLEYTITWCTLCLGAAPFGYSPRSP